MMENMSDRMSFFAKLYGVGTDDGAAMMYLYVTIVVLSIIVYNLGFAKKLPILLNVVVYGALLLGCTVLTFFGVFLPMAEGLVVAALFLGIYRFRLHRSRKATQEVV